MYYNEKENKKNILYILNLYRSGPAVTTFFQFIRDEGSDSIFGPIRFSAHANKKFRKQIWLK